MKEISDARQLFEAGSLRWLIARMRCDVACATSRIEIVPHVRCGDRREQASKAVTGLDI